jgi:predicted dehydrogenase
MAKRSRGPIRVGVIGLGRAGWSMHVGAIRERPKQFQLVAVCDAIPDRLDEAKAEFGCATGIRSRDLLADPGVELVSIASRSVDHYRHARAALKAGKHVYVDKPMCLTWSEAKRLRDLAANSPGRLLVGHNRRFDKDFLHVREIIRSGILGDVYQVKLTRASYARRDDWQALQEFGGGQLLNWGPHLIDHALQFLDSPLASFWSHLKRIAAAGDAEDHVKLVLLGENERIVEVEISGGAAIGGPPYLVWGTRGALSCDSKEITLRYLNPRKKHRVGRARSKTTERAYGSTHTLHWIDETVPVGPKKTLDIWDEVHRTLRRGSTFPVSLDEAVEVMRVISLAKKGTAFAGGKKRKG